jgi:flagellar basal-body rod modification protein FlgD
MALPLIPLVGAVLPSVVGAIGAVKDKLTQAPPKQDMDKETFLKLLVEQIRHQDPLNPLSNDKFIEQSTAFSTLEQLHNIQKSVEAQTAATTPNALAAGTSFLGKNVTASEAGFTYAGATVTLPFTLDGPVGNAVAEILNGTGDVVGRVALGPKLGGPQAFELTPGSSARGLAAGAYRYRIVSQDLAGRTVPLPAIRGLVTGAGMDGGAATLQLGSLRVALGSVASVGIPTN